MPAQQGWIAGMSLKRLWGCSEPLSSSAAKREKEEALPAILCVPVTVREGGRRSLQPSSHCQPVVGPGHKVTAVVEGR